MKITDDMLTEWISVDTPPVRNGWYEVRYEHGDRVSLWFDGAWRFEPDGKKTAFGNLWPENEYWRGLNQEAKEV